MELWVLVRDDGMYVARPGAEKSYTAQLEKAQTFAELADAVANSCHENETAVSVVELLRKPSY